MIKVSANRYILSFILCFSFCALVAQTKSTNIQTINGASYYIHKIEKGQSLYSISKLYNVSLDEIYANNPDVKTGTKANQEIRIPAKAAAVVTKTVSPAVVNNTAAVVSTTLPPANAGNQIDTNLYYTHKVEKKETLYAITKKFNISEAELKILNPSLMSKRTKRRPGNYYW